MRWHIWLFANKLHLLPLLLWEKNISVVHGDEKVSPIEVVLRFDCLLHILSFIVSRGVSGQEPYLQSVCDCCSYRLDPEKPVRFLSLKCESGESEPVVLPIIHSCECTSCQGESHVVSMNVWLYRWAGLLVSLLKLRTGILMEQS